MVEITGTGTSKHLKKGQTLSVGEDLAETLIKLGRAVKKGDPTPEAKPKKEEVKEPAKAADAPKAKKKTKKSSK